jgi:hypothetical protein
VFFRNRNWNFLEGSFMSRRPIVVTAALALITGVSLAACQGGEDTLPLPPSDGGAADASKDGAASDAETADGARGDAAPPDASEE